jgi:localization factor PodJL
MKPGVPWSVKGIEPEAREAAKYAARRSGMTLGEWLNSVILEQADSAIQSERHAPPPVIARARPASDTAIRLEDLAHQLARLTQREQDTAAGLAYEQPAAAPPDASVLESISTRLDNNERQTVDAFAAVNERLNSITQKLNESQKVWQPSRPEDVPGYQALEGALRNIVDHIEVSEKRTREHLRIMQDRLSELSNRAQAAPDERIIQTAPVITRLESRINDLAVRLERADAAARQDMPPLVENQLSKLAERIESVRQSSETAIQRAQTVAAQGARAELEEVETRIHALLKEAQSSIDGTAGIGKLHGEIESLNQRIDDLRADAASERDLHALKLAIEQLSARIAQGPDLRPLADMDRRLAELAQRLEQSRDYSGLGSQLGDIDSRIYELDQRLTALVQQGNDPQSLCGFEQHIASLSDRLGAAEQQFSHIATLERTIHQLFESIEQSRGWTQEIAEDAANRMADRLIQSNPAWATASERGPSPELRALEDGLAAVRASAEAADQRNQETLVALHETLEQIVIKLAELETAPPQPEAPSTGEVLQDSVLPKTPPLPDLPNLQAPPPPPRTQGPDVFGVPHAMAPAAPHAPLATEPVLPPLEMPQAAQPAPDVPAGIQDDFISAARRAAQAAASSAAAAPPAGTSAAAPASDNWRRFAFSLPFRARRKEVRKPEAHPILPAPGHSRSGVAARRIPLIAAGLVLLVAVTAITFKQIAGGHRPAPEPQSQSQSDSSNLAVEPNSGKTEPLATQQAAQRTTAAEGNMPVNEVATPQQTTAAKAGALLTDDILTAALPPGKSDASLSSIVAEPGQKSVMKDSGGELPGKDIQPESLRQAAGSGNAAAQFIVASRYLDGQTVQQDFTEAARWYQKAASQGLAPAQYRIATLFERGKGVPLDMATARLWYERAAERGNIRAMHNVAVIYASAQSGSPDYAKAGHWFAAAAEHGLKDSQFNLAVLYERGMGVKKSLGDALFWYSMAAAQDDADAAKRASALRSTLAPAIAAEVKDRIAKWKAAPALQDANVVAVTDQTWQVTAGAPSGGASEHQATEPAAESLNPVQRAQRLLMKHGFNIGTPDGKMGARTANAIRLFELQSGMRVTGEVSDQLLDRLESVPATPPA